MILDAITPKQPRLLVADLDGTLLHEDERRVIPTLPQGLGVWRVGAEHPRMVRALAGPTLSALFDTSDLRSAA